MITRYVKQLSSRDTVIVGNILMTSRMLVTNMKALSVTNIFCLQYPNSLDVHFTLL